MVLSAGTRLGPYEILAPLGAGGMGEVYRARDPRLDREVAVKVLPDRFAESEEALLRFEREAKVVAALSHPNILSIHDFGVEAGVPYAVTELLEGETLRERLARSTLPWRDAVEIGASVADGLSAAHARGVVHRDLKPDNVFLTSDGRVKILDFGLAKRDTALLRSDETAAPTAARLTEPGTVLGTVGYMPPEQVRGLPISPSGDLFSFGCVLYEAVTGRPAFGRETTADAIAAILNEEAPDLAEFDRDVPAALASVVARCLRKSPGERFESARDLAFALRTVGRPDAMAPPSSPSGRASPGPRSIAVLPFADMSAEKNQDYFCEGIAEEIITALTAVPALRVAARTSSFTFRAGIHDTREIGRRLAVETLLDGSVRKSGDRIRVTVQLVDAGDGYQLWSQRYERDLKDVFAIQDEIALAVVDRLRGSLLGRERAHLVRKATDDPEAYNFYLRGRYHWNRQTGDDLARAIEYFDRAIAADPGYAAAHAALADTYSLLVNWGAIHPREIERGRTAALRATRLDEGLAAGHSSLAVLHAFEGRWKESDREHRRALELNPGDATGHMLYAMSFLAPQTRADEAIAHMERAQELDPVSPFIAVCMSWAFYVARHYERARDVVRRALDMEPAFALAHWTLGLVRSEMGDTGPAIASLEEAALLSGDGPFVLGDLGRVYAAAGRVEDARKVLGRLEELSGSRYVSPLNRAVVHLGLAEVNAALDWLERSCDERGEQVYWLKASPRFDPLRGHPRFAACLERLGFGPEMPGI